MRKVLFTIIAVVVAVGAFFVQDYLLQNDEEGTVSIVIVDDHNETTTLGDISFTEEDTLLGLLEDRFTITCADNNYNPTTCDNAGMMGKVVLGIDDLTTDWTTTYIAIYVNNEYSNYGIDDIVLQDGNTYTFTYTEVGEE